jgi:hypothetical protein
MPESVWRAVGYRDLGPVTEGVQMKTAPGDGVDLVDQLERLAKLKQQGVLTDDEFAAQKAKILRA